MKRILIGILIGVSITILVQRGLMRYSSTDPELALPDVVERTLNDGLSEARVLDMSWSPSSTTVNFTYDRLYDVHVSYERRGIIKRFTMPLGLSGKVWITPPASELEILDDKAEQIHQKSRTVEPAGGAYVSPAAGDPSAHP